MIASIKGILIAKSMDTIIVEVSGIGYQIGMATASIAKLPDLRSEVQILTRLHIKDDSCVLYGFLSEEEKDLFEKLVSVSGVGPKAAFSLLSSLEVGELISAITSEDASIIQRAPGIGKKMAFRIALELKDKFEEEEILEDSHPIQDSLARTGAKDALLSMGFTSSETRLALKGAPPDLSEAQLVQYALKRLGR
jgi:holliday junction DNA helicase RuvA